MSPQFGRIELAQIDAVDQHGTRRRPIQTENELFQRCLARADTSQDGNVLTRPDAERYPTQGLDLLPRIGETNVTKLDLALEALTTDEGRALRTLDLTLHQGIE
ncbi:hypothetical protein SDC9_187888 [bioreactor metagenome]|uniref:Uncharacterized protein n=1 Tax=bioreactor metagenome TaxID=1076179 RepID=A0A645HPF9_9ZZZZ